MIRAFAPAKVNLALHVTGQRSDGYHLLDSLVVFADVGDRLTFEDSDTRSLSVTGPFADGVPTGAENLIWKAADLLDPDRGVAITLEKNLPHGAGLGGGSSDAAAALEGLMALWTKRVPAPERVLSLGADVPVCYHARHHEWRARISGIGERLDPVPPIPPMHLVLVNPRVPVPTGACFAALATRENAPMDPSRWSDADTFVSWLSRQRNDLETPALGLAPEIGRCLERLAVADGCRLARMSGSGATCFGLFDPLEAHPAAEAIRADHPDWWVVETSLLS
ncbi:4-(cytidine 5'-diphospho)-2-C-methyl-D-erythritol kinase [Rhodobacterales bacterium HKCCE3408]|nr:4-(cytidine 5'-diphospho)-2-C-methyl-D-erythritol kinase [Rhodobacterales bacterium HKCCE3408]